ncbi:PH domain-containing protein [Candidatus Micrarchaeota archaeon]|nr:PH domain-containing protein [Candidatus Micrarchaeota archaeon]
MPATIEQYPLDGKKILKRWITAMLHWAVLEFLVFLALFFAMAFNGFLYLFIWIGAVIAIAIWQYVYETRYFAAYYYDIGKDFLAIRKGWITPREVQLPYEKMQDVYMDQDLFDRLFGLWDVHVSTATMMSGMEAHMDGVNRQTAEKLRELLLDKIKSKRGKVTGYD